MTAGPRFLSLATRRVICALLAVSLAVLSSAAPARSDGEIVRPGQLYEIEGNEGAGCTLGFLFESPATTAGGQPTRWAMTAGHCTGQVAPATTWPAGKGPDAKFYGPEGVRFGEFRYALYGGYRVLDVALIELDPWVVAEPSVCYWGGPTALYTTRHDAEEQLAFFGNSNQVEPRTLYGVNLEDDEIDHVGVASTGDSGGPLLTMSGEAAGIYTFVGAGMDSTKKDAFNGTSLRVDALVEKLESSTGLELRLLTAPSKNAVYPADLAIRAPEDGCPAI